MKLSHRNVNLQAKKKKKRKKNNHFSVIARILVLVKVIFEVKRKRNLASVSILLL